MNPAPPAGEEEKILDWGGEEFDDIRKTELKTAKAWTIKEYLGRFWNYRCPNNAHKYFKPWYFWTTHSRLKPAIPAAAAAGREATKTFKKRLPNILTYFRYHITPVCRQAGMGSLRVSTANLKDLNSKLFGCLDLGQGKMTSLIASLEALAFLQPLQ
mgnify:CR=1 FL=1